LSERHIDAEGERRLKEAGFLPEESHVGKRRWKDPDTGRAMPGGAALDQVERREERELKEAGSRWRSRAGPIGVDPTPATCTLVGPPTTCTSAGTKGEGRIDTLARLFHSSGI